MAASRPLQRSPEVTRYGELNITGHFSRALKLYGATMAAATGLTTISQASPGHAFVPDLRRMVDALAPARLVPIHSFAGDHYGELFSRVDQASKVSMLAAEGLSTNATFR